MTVAEVIRDVLRRWYDLEMGMIPLTFWACESVWRLDEEEPTQFLLL